MSGSCYLFHIKVHASRHAVAVKVVVTRNLTLLRNMFLRGFKIFPTHGRCIDACSINTKLSTKSKLVIYDLNSIIILMCMILDISGRIMYWKIGLDIFCILCKPRLFNRNRFAWHCRSVILTVWHISWYHSSSKTISNLLTNHVMIKCLSGIIWLI